MCTFVELILEIKKRVRRVHAFCFALKTFLYVYKSVNARLSVS